MNAIKEAIEALQCMVDQKADYMLRNHLGNPYAEQSTKQALAALAALRSMQGEAAPIKAWMYDIVIDGVVYPDWCTTTYTTIEELDGGVQNVRPMIFAPKETP